MNNRRFSKFLVVIITGLVLFSSVGTSATADANGTTSVSIASEGAQRSGSFNVASISSDGRYMESTSGADNLFRLAKVEIQ